MSQPEDTNNCASARFPEPRPFKVEVHENLCQGLRDGHRCQMIMAPTWGRQLTWRRRTDLDGGRFYEGGAEKQLLKILARMDLAGLPPSCCVRISSATSKPTTVTMGGVRTAG